MKCGVGGARSLAILFVTFAECDGLRTIGRSGSPSGSSLKIGSLRSDKRSGSFARRLRLALAGGESMTSTELERLIREKLEVAGLLQVLDEYKSQFLEFPDGLFAELVLNDGSKLVDVERIAREVRDEVKKQGIDVDVIVRSIWSVKEIGNPGPATAPSGGLMTAWRVPVALESGGARRDVQVDVSYGVVLEIKQRIAGKGVDETSAVKEIVREYIEIELSRGGESYWDPIRYPQQEINGNALAYLFMHTPVAENLGIQR
jgi:hypothetical protein